MLVVQYLARDGVGTFVRPPRGGSPEALDGVVRPHLQQLASALDTELQPSLGSKLTVDSYNRENWDVMADWLDERTRAYQAAFARLREDGA